MISANTLVLRIGLGRRVLAAGMAAGMAAGGVDGPLRSWRKKTLQSIFQSGASLRLQFPREDLGFCYERPGAAIISELPGSVSGNISIFILGVLHANPVSVSSSWLLSGSIVPMC